MQDKIKQSLKIVNYSGVAAITLLLASTVAFGVLPLLKSGKEEIAAADDRRASIARLESLKMENARAAVVLEQSQKRLEDAEKILPVDPPGSEFNTELNEVAKKAGIRILQVPPPQKGPPEGSYKSMQVTISGNGDWDSCYRFLAGIRSMDRVSRLDWVTIDVSDKDSKSLASGKPLCDITVEFSTFYMER
ncbi:MAG TPA: type 4a pilus biogenesis protein PilO [Phycisphaerae bacterium]|jgi:hypothetical protein